MVACVFRVARTQANYNVSAVRDVPRERFNANPRLASGLKVHAKRLLQVQRRQR